MDQENNDLLQRLAERADRVEDQDSIDAIARAKEIIEQSAKETKWTTEKPTEVGWYWAKWYETSEAVPIKVAHRYRDENDLVGYFASQFADSHWIELHQFHSFQKIIGPQE